MRANISGYEAVEDGLNAGGIDRFVCNLSGEPLRNAEKAICKGSFFASMHQRTACVISQEDADVIRYAAVRKEGQNAAFEIIILGRDLNPGLLHTIDELSVPLLVAEDVRDVRHMTTDALIYSELRQMPVAVFIPIRLLRSRQALCIGGSFWCDDLWVLNDKERSGRIAMLESKYNRVLAAQGQDQCLVIGISGCAGQICAAAGKNKGVSICKLDMLGKLTRDMPFEQYRKVIIIGHGSTYIAQMLRETGQPGSTGTPVELGADKLHEMSEIKAVLREFLPSGKSLPAGREAYHYDVPKVMKSALRPFTDLMCSDCPYRDAIKAILEDCRDISIYEDIYCERHGTVVRSGFSTVSSAYTGQMILTNRKDCYYTGLDVRYVEAECIR